MGGGRPSHGGDGGELVQNDPLESQTPKKDEEEGAMHCVLPPSDCGGDNNDDGRLGAIPLTRSLASRARTCMAIELMLEVSSTLYAYQ